MPFMNKLLQYAILCLKIRTLTENASLEYVVF